MWEKKTCRENNMQIHFWTFKRSWFIITGCVWSIQVDFSNFSGEAGALAGSARISIDGKSFPHHKSDTLFVTPSNLDNEILLVKNDHFLPFWDNVN